MKRVQDLYIFNKKISSNKMIFLFGPRQVGKTTLSKNHLKRNQDEDLYFNWDDPYVRKEYEKNPHFLKSYISKSKNQHPLIVFDEIHKTKNWKNILKGLYDVHLDEAQFMVTGSARLDYFRSSGDSLVGRYFSYKMLPLSICEASNDFSSMVSSDMVLAYPNEKKILKLLENHNEKIFKKTFQQLFEYGGFPEPFLKKDKAFSIKWRRDYSSLLTKEDIRDLTRIHDIRGIEQLVLSLPDRVGSPLSVNSLREDLQTSHKTVTNWLEALRKVYLIFYVMPWSGSITRSIKKEVKFYFYDWTFIEDPGVRFENMTAIMLLRMISRFNELGLGNFELRYVRTKEKEEVDFLIIKDNKPYALFEAKKSDESIAKSGHYFSNIFKVPYYQLVCDSDVVQAYPQSKYVMSAWKFLQITG